MDNDLLARGLRAPSQQMQPVEPMSQPAPRVDSDFAPDSQSAPELKQLPPLPELPSWPPTPVSTTPIAPLPTPPAAPVAHEEAAAAGDSTSVPYPDSRDEVPWDRPHDYDQPTDTATSDEQRSWDKPPDEAWVDSTPMWPAIAQVVRTQQTFETGDPDDAYAPLLGDLSPTTMARTWPETNGHDADRNAATVGQPGYAQAAAPIETAPVAQPSEQTPSTPQWPPSGFASSASEGVALPPADAAPTSTQWPLPAPAHSAPAATQWPLHAQTADLAPAPTQWPLPAHAADPGPAPTQWPLPAHAADPGPSPTQWPLPERSHADAADSASPLTLWPMAAQPTDYAQHQVGPTPPPELFATAVASPTTPTESVESPADAPQLVTSEPVHRDLDAWLNETNEWPSDSGRQPHEPPVTEPQQPEEAWFAEPGRSEAAFDEPQLSESSFADSSLSAWSPNEAEFIEAAFADPEVSEPAFNETELTDAASAAPELIEAAFTAPELAEAAFTEPQTTEPPPAPLPDVPASMVVEANLPVVAADGTTTPIVLRIELAIVNDQLRVLNVADNATNVTPDNESGRVTPRDPAPDPRTSNVDDDEQSDAAEFMAALTALAAPSDEPTPTVDAAPEPLSPAPTSPAPSAPLWAAAPFVSARDPQPGPAPNPTALPSLQTDDRDRLLDVPWAQDSPTMDPLAAIPALPLVAQPVQPVTAPDQVVEPIVDQTPLAPSATSFATPVVQQPPPAYVAPIAGAAATPAAAVAPAASVDQNLWFLSSEPHDVDAVTAEDGAVARKGSSTVLTALVTIGMAVLVLVLVLAFFSLITSLLG